MKRYLANVLGGVIGLLLIASGDLASRASLAQGCCTPPHGTLAGFSFNIQYFSESEALGNTQERQNFEARVTTAQTTWNDEFSFRSANIGISHVGESDPADVTIFIDPDTTNLHYDETSPGSGIWCIFVPPSVVKSS